MILLTRVDFSGGDLMRLKYASNAYPKMQAFMLPIKQVYYKLHAMYYKN